MRDAIIGLLPMIDQALADCVGVVDEVSLDYLQGATIDYVNDPERGAGFAVSGAVAKEATGVFRLP